MNVEAENNNDGIATPPLPGEEMIKVVTPDQLSKEVEYIFNVMKLPRWVQNYFFYDEGWTTIEDLKSATRRLAARKFKVPKEFQEKLFFAAWHIEAIENKKRRKFNVFQDFHLGQHYLEWKHGPPHKNLKRSRSGRCIKDNPKYED